MDWKQVAFEMAEIAHERQIAAEQRLAALDDLRAALKKALNEKQNLAREVARLNIVVELYDLSRREILEKWESTDVELVSTRDLLNDVLSVMGWFK